MKSYIERKEDVNGTLSLVTKMVSTIKVMATESLFYTLKHIAQAVNDKALSRVVDTVTNETNEISYALVQQDLNLNFLHRVDYKAVIQLYNRYKKSNPLAATLLRDLVMQYLIFNKCSEDIRQSLCANFNFKEKNMTTEHYKQLMLN